MILRTRYEHSNPNFTITGHSISAIIQIYHRRTMKKVHALLFSFLMVTMSLAGCFGGDDDSDDDDNEDEDDDKQLGKE